MAGRKIFPQSVRLDEIKTLWYRETHARVREEEAFRHVRVFFFFFFLVSGALAAPVFHVVVPLTGGESLFFLVFLVTGMQLFSMSPHNVNSCALQVGRGKRHTQTGCCLQVRAKRCTCVMFVGPCHSDHLSTCTVNPAKTKPQHTHTHTHTHRRSRQEDASTLASWKIVSSKGNDDWVQAVRREKRVSVMFVQLLNLSAKPRTWNTRTSTSIQNNTKNQIKSICSHTDPLMQYLEPTIH